MSMCGKCSRKWDRYINIFEEAKMTYKNITCYIVILSLRTINQSETVEVGPWMRLVRCGGKRWWKFNSDDHKCLSPNCKMHFFLNIVLMALRGWIIFWGNQTGVFNQREEWDREIKANDNVAWSFYVEKCWSFCWFHLSSYGYRLF